MTETPVSWIGAADAPELVSVVIPTHNRAALLTLTLRNLFAQTYRPIEALVIDNASTDNTETIVEQAATDEGFTISYIRNENRGTPDARNLGCKHSRGGMIQFLDSDDLLAAGKIANQAAALAASPALGGVYGPWRCVYGDGESPPEGPLAQCAALEHEDAMLRGYVSGTWFEPVHGYLFRRNTIAAAGPWQNALGCGDDAEYLSRILAAGTRFGFVRNGETWYRRHGLGHFGSEERFHEGLLSYLESVRCIHATLAAAGRLDAMNREEHQRLRQLAWTALIRKDDTGLDACRETALALTGETSMIDSIPGSSVRLARLARLTLRPAARWLLGERGLDWLRHALRRNN